MASKKTSELIGKMVFILTAVAVLLPTRLVLPQAQAQSTAIDQVEMEFWKKASLVPIAPRKAIAPSAPPGPHDIHTLIPIWIRDRHDDTKTIDMPAFGKDEILEKKQIIDVAGYVLSLSGGSVDGADVAAGKAVFADYCAACHGEDAKGMTELGSPNLTDTIWLYGGDAETVIKTITNNTKDRPDKSHNTTALPPPAPPSGGGSILGDF